MSAKRALIVDDSKSARVFLARILEKYEIHVDSAESAEAAIDYLATHRPDVIFMDHLMPGMDGFQAVQAIKNNPITATIPIMMYTSQEGELYLGQARALGALGVMPKQIKPADVSKVLYQLHLLTDRRSSYQSSFRPVNTPGHGGGSEEPIAANDSSNLPKLLTQASLREQFAELRRALVAGVDTQTERITSEVRDLLLESLPVPPESPPPVPMAPERPWGWIVASVALAIALATIVLWRQQTEQLRDLTSEVAQLRREISGAVLSAAGVGQASRTADVPDSAAALVIASSKAVAADIKPLIMTVPYGADPFGGPRLETIRQLLDRLVKENRNGVVDIKSFAGRFCLMGNASDGFSLAPEETAFVKCDVIGNPWDEAVPAGQRIPLPLANLIGTIRTASRGALDIQPMTGDAMATLNPYPQISPDLTAGEWNRAGSANNRIEIRVR